MMSDAIVKTGQVPDRTMKVLADGAEVKGLRHVRLTADYMQTLFPAPYCLRIWNPTDEIVNRMMQAKKIEVSHEGELLAVGDAVEVYREVVPEGILLSVTFCLGAKFWEKYVCIALGEGMSAVGTVQILLSVGGSEFGLLSRPKRNPGFSRPQAFCGRLGNYVISLLAACGAAPYLVPAGIALRDSTEMAKEVVIDMDSIDGPWKNEVI